MRPLVVFFPRSCYSLVICTLTASWRVDRTQQEGSRRCSKVRVLRPFSTVCLYETYGPGLLPSDGASGSVTLVLQGGRACRRRIPKECTGPGERGTRESTNDGFGHGNGALKARGLIATCKTEFRSCQGAHQVGLCRASPDTGSDDPFLNSRCTVRGPVLHVTSGKHRALRANWSSERVG